MSDPAFRVRFIHIYPRPPWPESKAGYALNRSEVIFAKRYMF